MMSNVPMGKLTTKPAPFAPIRRAGVLLLLTAAATAVMVVLRVAGDTDQATLIESLRAIAEDRGLFGAGGAARFVSGVTLLAAALALSRMGTSVGGLGCFVPVVHVRRHPASSRRCRGRVRCCWRRTICPTRALPFRHGWKLQQPCAGLLARLGSRSPESLLSSAPCTSWRVGGNLRKAAVASAVIGLGMQLMGRLGDDHAPHRGSRVLHLADCRRSDANHVARRKAGGWPAVRREGWQSEPLLEGGKKVRSAPCFSIASTSSPRSLTRICRVRCSSVISRLESGNAMETGFPTSGLGRNR